MEMVTTAVKSATCAASVGLPRGDVTTADRSGMHAASRLYCFGLCRHTDPEGTRMDAKRGVVLLVCPVSERC